jgi:hypothetical protein
MSKGMNNNKKGLYLERVHNLYLKDPKTFDMTRYGTEAMTYLNLLHRVMLKLLPEIKCKSSKKNIIQFFREYLLEVSGLVDEILKVDSSENQAATQLLSGIAEIEELIYMEFSNESEESPDV